MSQPEALPESTAGAWKTHAIPFLAWLFFMQMLGDPAGWKYAVRSVACLGLFLYFRPWRWYPRLNPRNLGWSVLVGVAVFLFWIAFETDLLSRHEGLHRAYLTVGTMPFWKIDPPLMAIPYDPEVCGWPFTVVRLLGSALVISFIEEFFFRGFLYRWMIRDDFLKVPIHHFDKLMFFGVAFLFGVQHREWLAGILCGVLYGGLVLRTRDIWAAGVAHAITNFLLGVYVIWAEKYEFWS